MKAIEEYYDKLIKETEEMFDEMIEGLEEILEKWQRLSEIETIANAWKDVGGIMELFGYTVEDVLNDVPGAFDTFEAAWIGVLGNASAENDHFIQGLSEATGKSVDEIKTLMSQVGEFGQSTTQPLEDAGNAVENVGTKASAASSGMGSYADSTQAAADASGKLKENSDGVAENIDGINTAVSGLGSVDFSDLEGKLETLKLKLEELQQAIAGEDTTSILGALNSLATSVDLTELETQFATLLTSVNAVTSALGGGGGAEEGAEGPQGHNFGPNATSSAGETEGAAGNLLSALQEIQGITFDDNIIEQFNLLKEAIDNATNAIDGSASSEGGEGEGKGSGSGEGGEGGEGEEGNFVQAIEHAKEATETNIGADAGDEGETVIGCFNQLGTAIEETTALIAPDDESMMGQIKKLPEETQKSVDIMVEQFGLLAEAISECLDSLSEMLSTLKQMQSITFSIKTGPSTTYTGTARLSGISNLNGNWGFKGGETLIGEIGPELAVLPNGTYKVFDRPQLTNLPKGTVIFNALQTEEILDKKNQIGRSGKSNANGSGLVPLADDRVMSMMNLAKALNMDTSAIKTDIGDVKRYTEEINRTIQNTVNNNATTTNVNFGDMNFTCNGITAPEVLGEIQNALNQTFEGMALNAYQRAMAR